MHTINIKQKVGSSQGRTISTGIYLSGKLITEKLEWEHKDLTKPIHWIHWMKINYFFFFALSRGRIHNNLIKWGIHNLVWKSKDQILTAVCTRVTWVWDILLSRLLSSDSSPGPLHSRPWTCTQEAPPPGWLPRVSGLVVKNLHSNTIKSHPSRASSLFSSFLFQKELTNKINWFNSILIMSCTFAISNSVKLELQIRQVWHPRNIEQVTS